MSGEPSPALGRDFDAYQSFVLGAKLYWTRTLYPSLRTRYRREAACSDKQPRTADEVEALLAGTADYQVFAWLERHLQRMKYSGRLGLVPAHEPHRAELERWQEEPLPDGLLTLHDGFEPPEYFTRVDIHQHPGGVCGDTLAGIVYERGARSTTPLLERDLDLHHRLVAAVRERLTPKRIIDLGCGFGKSTQPFYTGFRDAQTLGIDVSAPCLKLAAAMAAHSQAGNVRFEQASAERSGAPERGFDLVTSTMLLHEMPPRAVEAVAAESYRLLESGGWVVHLDFLAADDPFSRFIHYGHSRRNNEPYMRPLNEMDLEALHRGLGFTNFQTLAFEEFPGALSEQNTGWRFPWTLIVAQKA